MVNWVVYFRFLEEDPDFIALSNKMRIAFKAKVKAEGKNEVITLKLTDASVKDQIIRQEMDLPNLTSKEEKNLTERGIQMDIENQKLLIDIIDEHGLPTNDWVHPRAAQTAFMIILHADDNPTLQERGLNLFKKALEEGKLTPSHYKTSKKECLYKFFFTFVVIHSFVAVQAQNLINNSSFNQISNGVFYSWPIPESASFIYNSENGLDTAIVFEGDVEGKNANSITYFIGGRAVIFSRLKEALEAGQYYKLRLEVMQADSSYLLLKGLCIGFNSKKQTDLFLNFNEVNRSKDWFKLESIYLAKGGEIFIYIGNISKQLTNRYWNPMFERKKYKNTWELRQDGFSYEALYNIDNITLEKLKIQPAFHLSKKFSPDDIFFETSKSTLSETSKSYLLILSSFLRTNSDLLIAIEGHADERGDNEYNLELSMKRATAVGEFLLNNGIPKSRIKLKWHGRSGASNAPNAYHLDRRVQFELTKASKDPQN